MSKPPRHKSLIKMSAQTREDAAEARKERIRFRSIRRIMKEIKSPVPQDVLFCQRYTECLKKCEFGGTGACRCDIEWFETRCPLLAAVLESRVNRATAKRCAPSNRARLNGESLVPQIFSMNQMSYDSDPSVYMWSEHDPRFENIVRAYEDGAEFSPSILIQPGAVR